MSINWAQLRTQNGGHNPMAWELLGTRAYHAWRERYFALPPLNPRVALAYNLMETARAMASIRRVCLPR